MKSWALLVQEGKALVDAEKDNPWKWGDLALEVEPMIEKNQNNGAYARLAQWAVEVGYDEVGSFSTLRTARAVSARWPEDKRANLNSWSVAKELMYVPNRFEISSDHPGLSSRAARDIAIALNHRKGAPSSAKKILTTRVMGALSEENIMREVLENETIKKLVLKILFEPKTILTPVYDTTVNPNVISV